MQKIVSITSQGQLTVPQFMLRSLGITGRVKAIVRKNGNMLEVLPKKDFWELGGSLKSKVILSDEDLRRTRQEFSKGYATTWKK